MHELASGLLRSLYQQAGSHTLASLFMGQAQKFQLLSKASQSQPIDIEPILNTESPKKQDSNKQIAPCNATCVLGPQ